jgi:hypothetical protein
MICFSCGGSQGRDNVSSTKQQDDAFYTYAKDWDLYRIPLIKPIQVISTIGYGDTWVIESPYQQIKRAGQIGVMYITVVDSVIIVDAGIVCLPGETTQAWFLIDTKAKTEKVYTTTEAYRKGLLEAGIKEEPKLYEVNEVYRQFKEKGTLPFGTIISHDN